MSNLRDIRSRIKSVKNTGQITRAMQLVAASKMKKAQDAALADRTYALLLADILAVVERKLAMTKIEHPLFDKREVKRRGIIIVSTDKGLCGGLNANLFKKVIEAEPNTAYVSIGKKASRFLARTKRTVLGSFELEDKVAMKDARQVLTLMREAYESGEIDSIEVLFPRFVNTMVQEPELVTLAPVEDLHKKVERLKQKYKINLAGAEDEREFLFEPSVNELLPQLVKMYLNHRLYHLFLEAKASEHSARMVAMKAATDNAKKLVEELTLSYNKERQAAITQEILEISAATQFN